MRFFKKVHYSLYKAADNNWYLGYYDCRTSRTPVCSTIAPIAGPLKPYVSGSPQLAGLRFAYYDTTGAVLPGVSITLTNKAQGTVRNAQTNEAGVYQFSFLPPGAYSLEPSLAGRADQGRGQHDSPLRRGFCHCLSGVREGTRH